MLKAVRNENVPIQKNRDFFVIREISQEMMDGASPNLLGSVISMQA
jgi:hypothetical protein